MDTVTVGGSFLQVTEFDQGESSPIGSTACADSCGSGSAKVNGSSDGNVIADPDRGGSSKGRSVLSILGDTLGKIWSLPSSVVGFVFGGAGYTLGNVAYGIQSIFGNPDWVRPTFSFGNNALQFENNPLSVFGALTTGNVINYGGGLTPANVGEHEGSHTFQGQSLGPFYLPFNIVGQFASLVTYPVSSWRGPSPVHGKANFMETGPQSSPPRLWPWK